MTLFPSFFVNKTGGYEIEQSLRFDGGSHLARTFGATGNGRIWSLSVWVKRAGGIGDNDRDIFGAYTGSYARIGLVECGAGPTPDLFGVDQGGPASNGTYYANGRRRDPSAWYHLVISVNYNTPSVKIWVNGVLEGQAQNSLAADGGLINSGGVPHHIGSRVTVPSGNNRWLGYMAEFHFLDTDSQLSDPYDFGEFDNNGVWRPIEYTGSYGDNGFYMKFDPSATNGIGHDHSGNGNHFTSNGGFTTSGTGTDVMSDTPTTNWCTLNPLNRAINDLFDGNLVATRVSGTGFAGSTGTLAVSSGKWYYEVTASTAAGMIGMVASSWTVNLNSALWWNNATGYGFYGVNGNKFNNGSNSAYGSAWSADDVIGVAMDLDNGAIYFAINNTWQNSGDPTSGSTATGAAYSGISANEFTPVVYAQDAIEGNYPVTVNFGQRAFAYTPPTGYQALNTANLPAPDIKDGSDYFNTVLYTGNNTNNRTIPGVGFQPDFVWVKNRSDSDGWPHILTDAVRGGGPSLQSNSTDPEVAANSSGYVSAFASDGFVVTEGDTRFANTNGSGSTYVSWNWLAGGSGSSNTDGSITSTVSANPTAGFSIVSYQGTGANATVGHNLGIAPSFILGKNRDVARPWGVYHQSIGATHYLRLDSTDASSADSRFWNNTAPTSTLVHLGSIDWLNENYGTAREQILYCFAEVEGYSKFGSYIGNGNADGPFVYCGFRPAWVMVKRSSSSGTAWTIIDSARDDYNPGNHELNAENSQAELTAYERFDLLSNGFKQRSTFGANNLSGETFIYAAFAENPFGGSGVSPATAR